MYLCCLSLSGCEESYEVEENRYACVTGCKLQEHIPSPESYLEVSINHRYYISIILPSFVHVSQYIVAGFDT